MLHLDEVGEGGEGVEVARDRREGRHEPLDRPQVALVLRLLRIRPAVKTRVAVRIRPAVRIRVAVRIRLTVRIGVR